MSKTKLLIYSDCFIYSGSENVIENILESAEINDRYQVRFYYAFSRNYSDGIGRKFPYYENVHPVKIFSSFNHFSYSLEIRRKANNPIPFSLQIRYTIYLLIEKTSLLHLLNFIRLYYLLKRENPHILFINNGGYPGAPSCRLAVLSARIAGIKHILFNVNNIAYPQKHFIEEKIDVFIDKSVSWFITASKAAGYSLIKERNFSKSKWINIPNTLLKKVENELPIINEQLRKEFAINNNELILGAVGLLTNRKGFHVLIDAIYLLKERIGINHPFKVFIFGEGEDRLTLEEKIISKGLNNIVFLPGFRNNILSYIKDFDIFLAPSLSNEDFPYVILEAMALSKPVIGTNLAGIPEQVDNMKTGFIIPAGNPQALADAIEKLILKKESIIEMGKAGYLKYKKMFSNEVVIAQYLDLFNLFR